MAFNRNNLELAYPQTGRLFQQWHYQTQDDTRATVDNASYFNHPSLRVGDIITANCKDGTLMLRIKTLTDSGAVSSVAVLLSAA